MRASTLRGSSAVSYTHLFYPGYRYEVLITFDSDELLLEGRNIDWEDGGEHLSLIHI